MNLSKHQAEARADEIIARILNTGKPLAVFEGGKDVRAVATDAARYNEWVDQGLALIGVYDECCPVHWLASDLEGA